MDSHNIDLNLLRVFTSICRTGSFTQAAIELDLTQPSVSNAMKRLRRAVGQDLFIRQGQGITTTRAGQELFDSLEGAQLTIEQVINSWQEFDIESSSREFHLYVRESLMHLFQHSFLDESPNQRIKIILHESPIDRHQFHDELLSGKIELAIDLAKPNHPALKSKEIGKGELIGVASQAHPRIRDIANCDTFFSEYHALQVAHRGGLTLADLFSEGVLPRRKVHSEHCSLFSALATVSKSETIAIMPKSFAAQYADIFNLKLFQLPFTTKIVPAYMIWHEKWIKTLRTCGFVKPLQGHFRADLLDGLIFDPFINQWQEAQPIDKENVPAKTNAAGYHFPMDYKTWQQDQDIDILTAALMQSKFNQRKAADMLGLSYHQLRGMIRKYDISTVS